MDPKKTSLNTSALRYNPRHLTKKDKKKQKRNLLKSRKLYKKGVYYEPQQLYINFYYVQVQIIAVLQK